MPTTDETLAAILAELKGLRADVARVDATAARNLKGTGLLVTHLGAAPKAAGSSSGAVGGMATDAEMAGKYGDPDVRFDPRDWTGESCKRMRFSECPAEFLDLLAPVLDDFAAGETDPKKKTYKLRDARLARGWAARQRAGWRPPGSEETPPSSGAPASDQPPDEL